jgi:hypothetical protein
MNNNHEHIIEALKKITLDARARDSMHTHLSEYADFHRVRTPVHAPYIHRVRSAFSFVTYRRSAYAFASFLLVLTSGIGTSIAAQRTLPGDALYAVKINVNERVATALAFTSTSQAMVHAQLAERRLTEVTALAVAERLTPETRATLVDNFKTHVAEADSATQSIKDAGDSQASAVAQSDLDSRVSAGAQVIALLDDHVNDENKREIRQVLDVVRPTQVDTTGTVASVASTLIATSSSNVTFSSQEASAFIKDADIVRVALEARNQSRRSGKSWVGRTHKNHGDTPVIVVVATPTPAIATTDASTSTPATASSMMMSASAPSVPSATALTPTSTEVKIQENMSAKTKIQVQLQNQNNPDSGDEVQQWDKKVQEVLKQGIDRGESRHGGRGRDGDN